LFDPDPTTGSDRSLRAYIHAASSGRADLDAVVLPMATVDQQDVPPTILDAQLGAQLRSQGFDAAAIVMLCGCADDFTGQTGVSLDLIDEFGLAVHGLDGTASD
jgi:hypothetical protein